MLLDATQSRMVTLGPVDHTASMGENYKGQILFHFCLIVICALIKKKKGFSATSGEEQLGLHPPRLALVHTAMPRGTALGNCSSMEQSGHILRPAFSWALGDKFWMGNR